MWKIVKISELNRMFTVFLKLMKRYQYYAVILVSLPFTTPLARRKRCEGSGEVKPDDVISFLWYSPDSSKRHFCVLSLRPSVLVLSFFSGYLSPPSPSPSMNLQPSTSVDPAAGHGDPFCLYQFCFAYWRRLASHLNIILDSCRARAHR